MFLNCHTAFSLRYGTLTVQELVAEAQEHGVQALALTDIHSTSGCLDFVRACRKVGMHPLVGVEFREGDRLLYVGLARNVDGFRELNDFLSRHLCEGEALPRRAPAFENAFIIYPWGVFSDPALLADHEYVGVRPADLTKLFASPFRRSQDRLLIFYPVTYTGKAGYNLHRLLRAVDKNTLLSKLTPADVGAADEHMRPMAELMAWYRDYPQIITHTMRLMDSCRFDMDLDAPKNKRFFTGSAYDDRILLEKLAHDGMLRRYGPNNKEAKARVAREIEIIDQLSFSAYFLITWDFVRYAQSRNFFYVGRGSGANSIVAYCMGITDVDPIELDLYFERFLNPHRTSPPDFDIDFSWKDRDEVIDYVYKRYGKGHTALLATYNTFQGRSIIRELGKVFGLPKAEIDKLVERERPEESPDKIERLIYRYGKLMENLPNHLGIHPGGILITELPMHTYTATQLPPKGFPITQFDMFVAEDAGLFKFDILSQRGLGHIKDSAVLVRQNRRIDVDVHRVEEFKKDPNIIQMLREGRSIGCFYVESPAMRQLLGKLDCDTYVKLVAASSIIRPGVARSGMMREYIHRQHNPNDFEYIHPKMRELLEETYGVMVYQEDVIKVAHHFGGLDLAEADVLRRAMSGKYRTSTKLDELKVKYLKNCRERGYPDEISLEVWRQIESFSGYSFSKAHSASFAVESFQSLYFKTYFPKEFMVAVINNFGGFYRTEIYVHEARMAGANVLAPCVNHSDYLTNIRGDDVYLGLIHLKDLETRIGEELPRERIENGPFRNFEDLVRRVPMGLEQVTLLIRIGALRFTGKTKKQLLWEANLHYSAADRSAQKTVLFEPPTSDFRLPSLTDDRVEDAYDEIELLGFPLCPWFDLLEKPIGPNELAADDLIGRVGERVTLTGYLVTTKYTRTIKGEIMGFGCFLDHRGRFVDTTHFPQSLQRFPLSGGGVYRMYGKVQDDFDIASLDVERMEKLGYKRDPRGD